MVNCGISDNLTPTGLKYFSGYPYLLYVGNHKPHKNLPRLLQAFAEAKIDPEIRLILTGQPDANLTEIIRKNKIQERIVFCGALSETQLAEYYRGASGVLFPSLYEGFGLPVAEAMACGIPTLTSNVTSLPEVAGDAALLIDPYEVDAIAHGIEQIANDAILRQQLIRNGLERVKLFSWDKTAIAIQQILNEVSTR